MADAPHPGPSSWGEAVDELLGPAGERSAAQRLFAALRGLREVRAAALWAEVPGRGWLATRARGPAEELPPSSVVRACLEERLPFELPETVRVLPLPGARVALVVALAADADPDLVDALFLIALETEAEAAEEEGLARIPGPVPDADPRPGPLGGEGEPDPYGTSGSTAEIVEPSDGSSGRAAGGSAG